MIKKLKSKAVYYVLTAFFIVNILGSCKQKNNVNKSQIITALENKTQDQILVCAHRSFHTEAPENSLISIKKAIKVGIDFVEIDVRTTKDSVLVLMHDSSINRTTSGTGKVSDFTYKELLQFNLKMADSVTTYKIPLLKDALELLKDSKCTANLDLKSVSYPQLYKLLKETKMEHSVISFIGKKEKVMEMIGIDSLYAVLPLSQNKEDVLFYADNTYSSLQHFTDKSFTKELIELANKKKQLIFVNTLWEEDKDFILGKNASMDSVISQKPAIIQTDYPKKLLEYLREKGFHK